MVKPDLNEFYLFFISVRLKEKNPNRRLGCCSYPYIFRFRFHELVYRAYWTLLRSCSKEQLQGEAAYSRHSISDDQGYTFTPERISTQVLGVLIVFYVFKPLKEQRNEEFTRFLWCVERFKIRRGSLHCETQRVPC